MKKDPFEKKFKEAILFYPKKHWGKFKTARKNIAKIVGNSISHGEYGRFPTKTKNELSNALEICKNYEDDCDAVCNIEKYVFCAKNGKIVTRSCPKWENFRDEMTVHLKDLPNRGFVYIAWRAYRPFNVYYVGMTENSDAERILDLARHIKLTLAIERGATQFTIIYPDTSDNIKNVEASFIRIMKKLEHNTFNEKDESFDPWEGSEISLLKKFFEQMRKMVEQYIE
jgi:hypothetical protein